MLNQYLYCSMHGESIVILSKAMSSFQRKYPFDPRKYPNIISGGPQIPKKGLNITSECAVVVVLVLKLAQNHQTDFVQICKKLVLGQNLCAKINFENIYKSTLHRGINVNFVSKTVPKVHQSKPGCEPWGLTSKPPHCILS